MDVLKAIESLDPEKDAHRICFLSSTYHFPEDNRMALEFALLRTFCVPSIGELLNRTRQFTGSPQKRYDDTVLIMAEILEHGPAAARGLAAIARLNQIHGQFRISNEDYLYVLSTFLLEPVRWLSVNGWRPLTEKEITAGYFLWKQIGQLMGIQGIPENFNAFDAFNRAYEARNFKFNPGGRRVADATLALFLARFPRFVQNRLKPFIFAMIDEPVRRSFGFSDAPLYARFCIRILFRSRALGLRLLPKRKTPFLRTVLKHPSYPQGYRIEELGRKV